VYSIRHSEIASMWNYPTLHDFEGDVCAPTPIGLLDSKLVQSVALAGRTRALRGSDAARRPITMATC